MTNNDLTPEPCPNCGLKHQCICQQIPQIQTDWHIALLTHPNERYRDTNTGKLLHRSLVNSSIHTWDRLTPPASLIEMIESLDYQPVVLYPSNTSMAFNAFCASDTHLPILFILLDGTWQEARKMINKSQWLKTLTSVHLSDNLKSEYKLRRNQKDGNLCTYEVGTQLAKYFNENHSEEMSRFFNYYLPVFNADKSGHKYKP